MTLSTFLVAGVVLAVCAAVVGRGVYTRRHGGGGCSCGGNCGSCGGCGGHGDKPVKNRG